VWPSEQRTLAAVQAELARAARYDDESVVHDVWARQRYDCGCAGTLGQARIAAVTVAWHEAGHAVAALATGARFSSASIRHGHRSEGRVHAIEGGGSQSFVIDAAGQIAERLRAWTMLENDEDLRAWLAIWKGDGGDARRFRAGLPARFAGDEAAAWRHSEAVLMPLRLTIRQVARALLVHPRHLPYPVIAGLAQVRTPGSPGRSSSGSRRTAGTRPPRAATTGPAPRR
jgi:Peptidase M50B-like